MYDFTAFILSFWCGSAVGQTGFLQNMRHTAATLMLQNGVDIKTVSGMLGHYDAGFTLRTYTHSTNRQQAEAADMMGSLVAQSL